MWFEWLGCTNENKNFVSSTTITIVIPIYVALEQIKQYKMHLVHAHKMLKVSQYLFSCIKSNYVR